MIKLPIIAFLIIYQLSNQLIVNVNSGFLNKNQSSHICQLHPDFLLTE